MNNFKKLGVMLLGMIPLLLSACTGAVPWNKQKYAGLEEWSVDYQDGAINRVHYINGKEFGSSDIKIELADGTVLNFSGNDITAFKGQELRATVEQAVTEQVGSAAPGVVDAIIKALSGQP